MLGGIFKRWQILAASAWNKCFITEEHISNAALPYGPFGLTQYDLSAEEFLNNQKSAKESHLPKRHRTTARQTSITSGRRTRAVVDRWRASRSTSARSLQLQNIQHQDFPGNSAIAKPQHLGALLSSARRIWRSPASQFGRTLTNRYQHGLPSAANSPGQRTAGRAGSNTGHRPLCTALSRSE